MAKKFAMAAAILEEEVNVIMWEHSMLPRWGGFVRAERRRILGRVSVSSTVLLSTDRSNFDIGKF
jgi:hypothetical protein